MRVEATEGQRIIVDVDPDGWPFHIGIGDDWAPAMPERYMHRGVVKARAYRTCPKLPTGSYPLKVRDRAGTRVAGSVTIR